MNKQILFDEIVADDVVSAAAGRTHHRHNPLHRSIGYFLGFSLVLLPLPFGAVHEAIYLPYTLALNLLMMFVVIRERQSVASVLRGHIGRTSQVVGLSLVAVIVYAACQFFALGWASYSHPVVGSASMRPDVTQFVHSWRDIVTFFSVFLLTRIYLAGQNKRQIFLARMMMFSGFIVSLIALSHWFYDTGKLFWIFEPENVFPSNRARWPFVNANHLGDFLLPIAFLTLGGVINLFHKIFTHEVSRGRRRNRTLIALIGSEDFHLKVLKPILLCVPLLAMVLAILGSQSRGAWFGGSMGLALFFFLTSTRAKAIDDFADLPNVIPLEQRGARVRKRGRSEAAMRMDGSWAMLLVRNFRRFLKIGIAALTVAVLVFFLNSQGRELVAGRLEYGLLYSLEDIRWTFYRNSWSMFLDYPIFGIGLSSWFTFFSRYASPELAGLHAVYLHSDPYQFLIEMGIIGSLPIVVMIMAVIALAYRSISESEKTEVRVLRVALFCAVFSFVLACLPEFPLRVPAIQVCLASILAFFLAVCETSGTNNVSNK